MIPPRVILCGSVAGATERVRDRLRRAGGVLIANAAGRQVQSLDGPRQTTV
jgi:hypothetical protein